MRIYFSVLVHRQQSIDFVLGIKSNNSWEEFLIQREYYFSYLLDLLHFFLFSRHLPWLFLFGHYSASFPSFLLEHLAAIQRRSKERTRGKIKGSIVKSSFPFSSKCWPDSIFLIHFSFTVHAQIFICRGRWGI